MAKDPIKTVWSRFNKTGFKNKNEEVKREKKTQRKGLIEGVDSPYQWKEV